MWLSSVSVLPGQEFVYPLDRVSLPACMALFKIRIIPLLHPMPNHFVWALKKIGA